MNPVKPGLAQAAFSQLGSFDDDELFALAKLDLKKGDIAPALAKLKTITSGDVAPEGAYGLCGRVYLELGLPDRAAQQLTRHLALHPNDADEQFLLGSIHYQSGRADEALQCWNALLKAEPTHTAALLYRANLRTRREQVAEARLDLEELMKSTPVEHPYFKPAKELLQFLNSRHPAGTTSMPAVPYATTALASSAYKSGPAE